MKNSLRLLLIFILSFFIYKCGNGETKMQTTSTAKQVQESVLRELSKKKIYFGHQSVGYNIIDGVRELISNHPEVKINIIESTDSHSYNNPAFGHSKNGKNLDPKSKVDDFEKTMNNGLGNKTDIAFFKFCYVDFNGGSDVSSIFKYYVSAMDRLEKKYPRTTFIHISTPLSNNIKSNKIKELIKGIIGKKTETEKHRTANIKRNQFNELLIEKYGKEKVFDLAKYESTYPGGKREIFTKNGIKYFALVPIYSYDGGHLNELGRKFVSKNFLDFLAGLLPKN